MVEEVTEVKIKESFGRKLFLAVDVAVLVGISIVCLYPILYVLFASLSDGNLLMAHKGVLIKPLGFTTAVYRKILAYPMLLSSYLNTLKIIAITLVFNIVLTSFGAYFLSRKNVVGENLIMMLILITMYFNGGLIPNYLLVKSLNLINTHWALILPAALNTYNLIVLRTAFASVPDALCESAKIDGAGHFVILFKIVMPLSKASIAVIILYYMVAQWNSWFSAMIYIDKRTLYPLQLLLRELLIQNDTSSMTQGVTDGDLQAISETMKYAIVVVATLPILCIYPYLQKYFTKGVMIGAVKG